MINPKKLLYLDLGPALFFILFFLLFWGLQEGMADDSEFFKPTAISLDTDAFDRMIQKPGGKRIVVVMASWCAPCIRELPLLVKLQEKYKDQGLSFIGMSVDYAGAEAMNPFLEKFKVNFPVYWVGEKGIERYELKKIPQLLFVEEGKIVNRLKGMQSKKALEERISRFLEEKEKKRGADADAVDAVNQEASESDR